MVMTWTGRINVVNGYGFISENSIPTLGSDFLKVHNHQVRVCLHHGSSRCNRALVDPKRSLDR